MSVSFFAIRPCMIWNANINGEKKNMTHILFLSFISRHLTSLLESGLCTYCRTVKEAKQKESFEIN